MEILHQYQNGNTNVVLYTDGTKERTYEGEPVVVHPESIDVKITNFCLAGCSYCHEQSTGNGTHADLNVLSETLKDLSAGVELAIGGGNPLDHPDLFEFLEWMKERGLVANMTINQKHIGPFQEDILFLIERNLIKGVGISYSSSAYLPHIAPILRASDNVVFHVIMGINKVDDVDKLSEFCTAHGKDCKILILGYKNYGFGINYYLKNKNIEDNKYQWYTGLALRFKKENLTLSFDNLGLAQMKLERYFTSEAWNNFFMGGDGKYTMYIDAVKQQYATSSTTRERVSFSDKGLLEFFKGQNP